MNSFEFKFEKNKIKPDIKTKVNTELAYIISNKKKTKKKNVINMDNCKNCNSYLYDNDGLIICNKCGLYHRCKIDMGQESYNYNDNKSDPCRTGLTDNQLIPSSNKGTIFGYNSPYGKKSNKAHNNLMRSMNNWKTMNYKDNNMLKRFNTITSICNNAGINNIIVEDSKEIFYNIHKIHSPRRNKLLALMASSVIISLKKHDMTFKFDKIASIFNISKKILRNMLGEYEHYWKEICDNEEKEQLKLAKESLDDDNKNGDVIIDKLYQQKNNNNEIIFKSYFNILNIDLKYLDKIEILYKWINDNYLLIEHVSKSIAACLIYTICNLYNINIKKKNIASVCNTSTITINKCYNKLVNKLDDIIKLLNNN